MTICAATNNPGKLKELRRILEAQGHTVKSQKELGIGLEPEETGATFAENALIKAREICRASGLPTVADDSGLAVEALFGAPGVYSARYCGVHGRDGANNEKLLAELAAVPEGARGAKFVSAVCLYLPGGRQLTVTGECRGRVGFSPVGENGFGYDPLFIPDEIGRDGAKAPNDQNLTYAQLTDAEKDAISHRGEALRRLQAALPAFLDQVAAPGAPIIQIESSLGFERDVKRDGDRVTRGLR